MIMIIIHIYCHICIVVTLIKRVLLCQWSFSKYCFLSWISCIRFANTLTFSNPGSPRSLYLLPSEDVRTPRHRLLCHQEEGTADNVPPPLPPHSDANDLLGGHQVLPWGSWNPYWGDQLVCAYHYVHILYVRGFWSAVPEVSVLEEVYNYFANGMKFYIKLIIAYVRNATLQWTFVLNWIIDRTYCLTTCTEHCPSQLQYFLSQVYLGCILSGKAVHAPTTET